jgi:peptidoglycan-N-acetylglucosamine deacetylase
LNPVNPVNPVYYRWRPAAVIRASFVLHAAAVVAAVIAPVHWPWALAAVAGNHLFLFGAVFWPRARLLGPNLSRLPAAAVLRNEVCLTFDDGPDPEVTRRVLDLLDRHHAKASFFCVGARAAMFPEIVKEIVRRGHSVENHSQRHSWAFACYGMRGLRREVEEAQQALAAISGRRPSFFRAPVGLRSPLLDPVLAACGLRYVSWTRRGLDGISRDPVQVLRRLTRGIAAGDVLMLHDSARTRTPGGEPVVLAVLPALLEQLAAAGLRSVPLPAAFDGSTG